MLANNAFLRPCRARDRLREDVEGPLTIDAVAREAAMSPNTSSVSSARCSGSRAEAAKLVQEAYVRRQRFDASAAAKRRLLQTFAAAMNAQDEQALLALFTPDGHTRRRSSSTL